MEVKHIFPRNQKPLRGPSIGVDLAEVLARTPFSCACVAYWFTFGCLLYSSHSSHTRSSNQMYQNTCVSSHTIGYLASVFGSCYAPFLICFASFIYTNLNYFFLKHSLIPHLQLTVICHFFKHLPQSVLLCGANILYLWLMVWILVSLILCFSLCQTNPLNMFNVFIEYKYLVEWINNFKSQTSLKVWLTFLWKKRAT